MSAYELDDPGPEVFETSDIESIEDLTSHAKEASLTQNENNLEISEMGFSASTVRERFESYAILEPNDINYLGSVLEKSLGDTGLPVVRWAETKEQKLARIERELEELKEGEADERLKVDTFLESLHELTRNNGKSGYYYEKMSSALDTLESKVNRIYEPSAVGISKGKSDKLGKLEDSGDSGESNKILAEISELESRLAGIEASLGPTQDLSLNNLRVHLNDLNRKLSVISNPTHSLEPVISKVSKLNKNLEDLLANERKVDLHFGDRLGAGGSSKLSSETPFEMKINRIHSKLPLIESANEILPSLVSRLRSLHETHSSLATSVAITGSIDQTMHTLHQDMQDWQKSLNEMNECLESREENFAANSALVDRKLQLMEERLATLQRK